MSILVGPSTRLVVQGITGGEGTFHTRQMIEYGTRVVAGVTPGKGGRSTREMRRTPCRSRCRSTIPWPLPSGRRRRTPPSYLCPLLRPQMQ